MPVAEETALLNFLQEPVFVLAPSGAILQANAAARRLTGADAAGRNLSDLISSPAAEFLAWLRRCSGTATPLVGSLAFQQAEGQDAKFRTYGARLSGCGDPVRIAVRCLSVHRDGFSLLAKQVLELNTENRERQRAQAILEEALADKEILLRELHHRAKNNIQVIQALFSAAQREAESEEVKRFLEATRRRLLAMGAAQQLMYHSEKMRVISAGTFIKQLCEAVGTTFGSDVRLQVTASEGELSNEAAFPLALIVNELLTNAFKHGLKGGRGTISVILHRSGRDFTLMVHDDGAGFAVGDPARRSSGLGLVQGLCRQLGGRLTVENVNGARVAVDFTDEVHRNGEA